MFNDALFKRGNALFNFRDVAVHFNSKITSVFTGFCL
jgi:hypothetical protein